MSNNQLHTAMDKEAVKQTKTTKKVASDKATSSGKKKILIAEDEKPLSKVMVLKLTKLGFDPTPVFNGEEAMAAIEKDSFDLILLDLMMPKMNGFEVLEALNAKGLKIPILILSNLSQPVDIQKAKQLGAAEVFVKSNTPIFEIVKYIENVLGIKS